MTSLHRQCNMIKKERKKELHRFPALSNLMICWRAVNPGGTSDAEVTWVCVEEGSVTADEGVSVAPH